jgi:transposase
LVGEKKKASLLCACFDLIFLSKKFHQARRLVMYLPFVMRSFQGFITKDLKEFHSTRHIILILEPEPDRERLCRKCGTVLGRKRGEYWVEAKHLKICSWSTSIKFPVAKCECITCGCIRSELIDFICPTSPHITMELAWWINRLTGITSVYQTAQLESIDKMTTYKVDKHILARLLQGYNIPEITHISVDEVYARGPRQQKDGETRDDLFLTVIVDQRTHKVIWVSHSRRKEALDTFFAMLGEEACKKIKVVATDQHEGYNQSVKQYCPQAKVIWDKFHLLQHFNDALNEERKIEFFKAKERGHDIMKLIRGKYRFLFLKQQSQRSKEEKKHLQEVMSLNRRMMGLELIKERIHRMFNSRSLEVAQKHFCVCYEWACEIKAEFIKKWIWNLMDRIEFWNYFENPWTTSVSEGINRAIKGLKWQAYGYKDMAYFALKIMQKCGYLNYKYMLNHFS